MAHPEFALLLTSLAAPLLTGLVGVSWGLARAAPEPVPWYGGVACEDEELLAKYPLPAPLTKDVAVHDLLGRPLVATDTMREFACTVFGKPWKAREQPTVLVFLDTEAYHRIDNGPDWPGDGARQDDHLLHIGMYQQDAAGQYRLVAKTSAPLHLHDWTKVSALDFAPYQLTPTERAFGVRLREHFVYGGGGGDDFRLDLFRVVASDIKPILSTVMVSTSATPGRRRDRLALHGDERVALIAVLPTTTLGVFDWKKRQGKRSAVFRWTGEEYDLQGRDPVEDVNPSR